MDDNNIQSKILVNSEQVSSSSEINVEKQGEQTVNAERPSTTSKFLKTFLVILGLSICALVGAMYFSTGSDSKLKSKFDFCFSSSKLSFILLSCLENQMSLDARQTTYGEGNIFYNIVDTMKLCGESYSDEKKDILSWVPSEHEINPMHDKNQLESKQKYCYFSTYFFLSKIHKNLFNSSLESRNNNLLAFEKMLSGVLNNNVSNIQPFDTKVEDVRPYFRKDFCDIYYEQTKKDPGSKYCENVEELLDIVIYGSLPLRNIETSSSSPIM